jgi:surface protein
MHKKLLTFCLLILFFLITKAQGEFITVWKPGNVQDPIPLHPPFPSSDTQAWFPVRGSNFKIYWEENGYPAHNATLTDVSSTYEFLLEFGTPHNPNPSNATYTVKVSNGDGEFHRIAFRDYDELPYTYTIGDTSKILEIQQWGNIKWSSMKYAFTGCYNMDMTATDLPNLSLASDMSYMFGGCGYMIGNSSINNWDTSTITGLVGVFNGCATFNQPIGNWNTSNVTSMAIMFLMAKSFNQPIGNWNTSNVTEMTSMFFNAQAFNQPIGNWNVSNVLDMEFMFYEAWAFNQDIGNWNTSEVIEMNNMFSNAKVFNQNIANWNTSKVRYMNGMFNGAILFNQNIGNWNTSNVLTMGSMFNNAGKFDQDLGKWNLSSLTSASEMFNNSGLTCQNYDRTLYGWRQNPATPNNINIGSASSMIYSNPEAVIARNYLITTKGWTINNDSYNNNCASILTTQETALENNPNIYPNPATDFIYTKNLKGFNSYKIFDLSGRIISQNILNENKIDVRLLAKGNYILQIINKENTQNFKFIKN